MRNDLAYSYYQAGQLEQARRLSREAMALAQQSGDAITLAHAYTVQGIILDALGDKAAENDSLQSALDHARRAGAKYEESLYLANLADHYLKNRDYATALRYAQQALPLTRELKNLNGETVALANIGLAQIALHDIEAGKRHLRAVDRHRRTPRLDHRRVRHLRGDGPVPRAGRRPARRRRGLHQHRALADADPARATSSRRSSRCRSSSTTTAARASSRCCSATASSRPSNCARATWSSACGGCSRRAACCWPWWC